MTTPDISAPPLVESLVDEAREAREAEQFIARLGGRKPVVTWILAGSSILIFGLQLLWGGGSAFGAASRMGAGSNVLLADGQLWRLLSVMVLHGSVEHLAFNMLALLSFGTFLERFLGWRRYLLLYVASGLGGSLVSLLRSKEVMSVGASGGIWGLMMAGALLVTWPRGRLPALVSASQRKRAWTPVVINAVYSFAPGIDWLGHFGGGIMGGLLILSGLLTAGFPLASHAGDASDPPARETFAVRGLALLSGAVLLLSVVIGWVHDRPWELQRSPELRRADIAGIASIELPRLVSPPSIDEKAHMWIFGSLKYDPVAFLISLPPEELSVSEAAQPAITLKDSMGTLNANQIGTFEGFDWTTPFELGHEQGLPYIHGRQTAPDGRLADAYYFILGRRIAYVMVLALGTASDAWKQTARKVPFSLTMR